MTTTPQSIVYEAIIGGAFNILANTQPITRAPNGNSNFNMAALAQVMSFVLGDENTPAQPDSVIAPIVQAWFQNQQAALTTQIAAQQAATQTQLTPLQTNLIAAQAALTKLSAVAATPASTPASGS